MTREHKLALILGFSVVLVVGVLISDHFSDATGAQLEDLTADSGETAPAMTSNPIERAHATTNRSTQQPSTEGALPGGFSIDGEQDTELAIADRPAFQSSREALLSEIQKSWNNMTENARPAAEIDRVATSGTPADERVELFTPEEETQQPIHTLSQLLRPEGAIPEPTYTPQPAARESALNRDVATKKHRVDEDESLWSIAEEHYGDGALYTKLAAFNSDRIGDDNSINVGVVLEIPPKHVLTGNAPAPRKATAPSRKASESTGATTYTVAEGDTLGDISMRLLGTSKRWREIVELNNIEDPDVVPVGTRLKIPASR